MIGLELRDYNHIKGLQQMVMILYTAKLGRGSDSGYGDGHQNVEQVHLRPAQKVE